MFRDAQASLVLREVAERSEVGGIVKTKKKMNQTSNFIVNHNNPTTASGPLTQGRHVLHKTSTLYFEN